MQTNSPWKILVAAAVATTVLMACGFGARSVEPQSALPQAKQGVKGEGVPNFWVRPGYRVTVAATDLGEARFMELGKDGWLYVSRPSRGDVLALRKKGERYEEVGPFIEGRGTVHGLCFSDGWLWFAQSSTVAKARDTNGDGKADEVLDVLKPPAISGQGGHWWRSLLVTSTHVFTSIGDTGNITDPGESERQKIWRFRIDGSEKTLWSSGIRNTEKLRFRPGTEEVWGSDHGSDWFGAPLGDGPGKQPITDAFPPEEFNRYTQGGFYGHPFVVGNRMPRVEYQKKEGIVDLVAKTIPPEWELPAHWAVNGFTFLTSDALGPDHKGDSFMAAHGSWNSTLPVGYCVERILFDEVTGKPYGNLTIVSCLSPSRQVLGRPVDCAEESDGSILFSDDQTQTIYRIARAK